MCKQARQCVSECVRPAEKKQLADATKDVAQITTQLVATVDTDRKDPALSQQVGRLASGLKTSICHLSDSLRQESGEMPVRVLAEAASVSRFKLTSLFACDDIDVRES